MIPRFRLLPALLFALVAAGIVYGGLCFRAWPLERDDEALLMPLASLSGPAEYLTAWRAGRILDVAPLRDLTFAADLRLSRALGVPTFTLTNIAVWLALVALALTLGEALGLGNAELWCLLLLLVAHPVYAISVAWISARKHLLAGAFTLAATLLIVRPPRRGRRLLPALLYSLGALSHPIHLLWPVWAWCYLWTGRGLAPKRAAAELLPAWAALCALGALNAWYYATIYVAAANGLTKFTGESGPAVAILAFGRATFNLLSPLRLSPMDYYPGSPFNLAGLCLLVPLAWLLARTLPWRRLLPWVLFSCLPLLLLTARPTRVFLSDTYLLLPSLGLWFILLAALGRFPGAARPALIALALLALPGLLATRTLATSFTSMSQLSALAYAREATPQVATVHAHYLYEQGKLREAAEISLAAIPLFPAAEIVFAQAVANDPRLDPSQKLSLLAHAPGSEPLFHYFRARTLAEAGRFSEALNEIAPGLQRLADFGDAAPEVGRDALQWAERSGRRTAALEAAVMRQLGGTP